MRRVLRTSLVVTALLPACALERQDTSDGRQAIQNGVPAEPGDAELYELASLWSLATTSPRLRDGEVPFVR